RLKGGTGPPISKRRAEICPRNAKQGRQVEKNRLGNEDGANGLIFQRLPRYCFRKSQLLTNGKFKFYQ
ncbi:hypothetical protein, partial [Pseudomonas syringae]|uniref:hypothetical protein n=1 Tax=Pseudomonas syringae TaxID=317 RepID=UPI001E632855